MSELTSATPTPFFTDFQPLDMEAGGVRFVGVIGGHGSPLLLLHGYPQTHITWRRVALALALTHTVIIPDLPGQPTLPAARRGVGICSQKMLPNK